MSIREREREEGGETPGSVSIFFLDGRQTEVMWFRQNTEQLDQTERWLLSELANRL